MAKAKEWIEHLLSCGGCTFLRESQDGLGGLMHPEKDTPQTTSYPSKYRKYEDDCRHGFTDIWAARGSARLIWNQTRTEGEHIMPSPIQIGQLLDTVKQITAQKPVINPVINSGSSSGSRGACGV